MHGIGMTLLQRAPSHFAHLCVISMSCQLQVHDLSRMEFPTPVFTLRVGCLLVQIAAAGAVGEAVQVHPLLGMTFMPVLIQTIQTLLAGESNLNPSPGLISLCSVSHTDCLCSFNPFRLFSQASQTFIHPKA